MKHTFIGYITDKTYDFKTIKQQFGIPSTYIVRRFELNDIDNIKIRIATLGVYSLYINNHLINDEYMSSDCVEYTKIITYRDYNISKYLVKGVNSLGIILSDGWYASNLSGVGRNVFGQYPLKAYYKIFSGDQTLFEADGSELATSGEIRKCDNQNGIDIDKNFDLGDFSSPTYDLSKFEKVETYQLSQKLVKSIIPPVTKHEVFQPKIVKQDANKTVYDFGQNHAGIIHSIFKGKKNDTILIKHGEFLTKEKDVYTQNLRSALARDFYTLKDNNETEFLPRHTFHGYRYIQVETTGDVETKLIESFALYTDNKRTGTFKTNNRLVNKIYSNQLWGQKSNFFSIPTDCPQRDERMGWTGDIQVFGNTAMYNYDCENFLKSYINSVMVDMDKYGDGVTCLIPNFIYRWGQWDSRPGWSDVIIVLPYYLYQFYGDKSYLRKVLPYMKRYMKNVITTHVIDNHFIGDSFGDWLSVFEVTDLNLYNDAYLAYDNLLLSKICELVDDNDKDYYLNNFNTYKKAFLDKYWVNNKLTSDTEGAYILAYSFNLLTKEQIKDNLTRKVKEYGHLTTGFHSTKFLMESLVDIDQKDLAYSLLNRKKYPSWGYMISCGATTIWERWDSYKKTTGFNKDGMNSFNHYSLGAVANYFYSKVLGISPTTKDPGFKTTIVSPIFDKSLSKVSGSYKSKYGMIRVKYNIVDNKVIYQISANTKINLEFSFNNKVIKKEEVKPNSFIFELEY